MSQVHVRCGLSAPGFRNREREGMKVTMQQWAERFQEWYESEPNLPNDPLKCWWVFWTKNPAVPPYDDMRAALAEFCDWEPMVK